MPSGKLYLGASIHAPKGKQDNFCVIRFLNMHVLLTKKQAQITFLFSKGIREVKNFKYYMISEPSMFILHLAIFYSSTWFMT